MTLQPPPSSIKNPQKPCRNPAIFGWAVEPRRSIRLVTVSKQYPRGVAWLRTGTLHQRHSQRLNRATRYPLLPGKICPVDCAGDCLPHSHPAVRRQFVNETAAPYCRQRSKRQRSPALRRTAPRGATGILLPTPYSLLQNPEGQDQGERTQRKPRLMSQPLGLPLIRSAERTLLT